MSDKNLLLFEAKIQYIFNDISLLKLALTHKSYAYEIMNKDTNKKVPFYERIEFLGDAVLELVVSEILYVYDEKMSEGQMTKKRAEIVCEGSLSNAMKRISGQDYIFFGKCEEISNGKMKDAILADTFEAVLGAIYLDAGFDIVKSIIQRLLDNEISTILKGGTLTIDYKTKLQEKLQKKGNVKIEYILIDEQGPEHDKIFTVEVLFNEQKIGDGIGKSKKIAEQNAAKRALEKICKNTSK